MDIDKYYTEQDYGAVMVVRDVLGLSCPALLSRLELWEVSSKCGYAKPFLEVRRPRLSNEKTLTGPVPTFRTPPDATKLMASIYGHAGGGVPGM